MKKIRTKSEVVEWKLTLDFCGPTVYVGNAAFDIAANQIFDMKLCGFPVVSILCKKGNLPDTYSL